MDEKPLRMNYYFPIVVDVERFAGVYAASLAGRPDLIGQGNHLMEALAELSTAVLVELEAESKEAAS